ncbi:MAG TPA: LLM class flavin-dependent oxidoreductase [Thermomicrobiales bacterium]|nr:LLM class flavin-dependent oxidoreductase [Thermomicrobiales bacterium]
MTALKAGLAIRRGSAPDFVSRIVTAENQGVGQIWTTVGGISPDPLTALAAAVVKTSSVVVGTSITPTYPRHHLALAAQAIAIDELAPGRLRLGIGPSHRPTIEGLYNIPMGKPLSHLREYLTILRGLLWDGKVDFKGEYYQIPASLPDGAPAPKIPIPISALRQNAFTLAGELADGAISWVTPVHFLVNTALPAMRAGAESAGRAKPPLIGHVPVAVSTDRDAARNAFRAQFPAYSRLPFYVAMFEDAGFPVTPQGTMTDELVDNLAVSGTPDQVRARLEAILAEGVDELLISHVIVNDEAAELAELSAILAG